jgi:hypothetical protein
MRNINTKILSGLMFLTAFVLFQDANAQSTDATIGGTIVDESGEVVQGATVQIINESTGFTSAQSSDRNGEFSFRQLPLGGPYTVNITFIGYSKERFTDIQLRLGDTVELDVEIREQVAEFDEVVVTSQADVQARVERLGGTTAMSSVEIASLPTQNRNFTNIASLSPHFGEALSMAGQRRMSTNITVDGMNARNTFTGGEISRGPFVISMEAIQEFEVITNTYDVTVGRQGGGGINAATKSGNNNISGSAFVYHNNNDLNAKEDFRNRAIDNEFSTTQWGFSLGGPIIKDKLHYFVAFDRQDEAIPTYINDIQTQEDENARGITRENFDQVINILENQYGLPQGQKQTGQFDRNTVANTFFARLDYQINQDHKLTLRNNYSSWIDPWGGGGDQSLSLPESWWAFDTQENSTLLSLRSSFSSNLTNEVKLQYQNAYREFVNDLDIPRGFVRVESELPNGSTGIANMQFGGHRYAPEINEENQIHLTNTTYYNSGDYFFSFGLDGMLTHSDTYISNEQRGRFSFNSIEDLENMEPFAYYREVPLEEQRPTNQFWMLDAGIFSQVEADPHPNVRAKLGIRWDVTSYLKTPDYNPLLEQELNLRTDTAPTDWSGVQPRVQVTWDIGGNSRDILKFGFGGFTSQPQSYVHMNNLLNPGTRIATLNLNANSGDQIPFPDFVQFREDPSTIPGFSEGQDLPPQYVITVDPDFQVPYTWKTNLNYNRYLTESVRLGINLLYHYTKNNYHYFDRNLVDEPYFTVDPDNTPVFVPANTISASGRTDFSFSRKSDEFGLVPELVSPGKSERYAVVFDADIKLPSNFGSINASYTWNQTRDNTSYNCCQPSGGLNDPVTGDPRNLEWAPSDMDFTHKVVLYGVFPVWKGFVFSGSYTGISGRPFNIMAGGDINGTGWNNTTAFIFDPNDPATPANVAESMQRVLDNPDNEYREYLADNLGTRPKANPVRSPFYHNINARISKNIRTFSGQSVDLSIDVFNVANLLNNEWGGRLNYGGSERLYTAVGFDQDTQEYEYRVNENFGDNQLSGNPYQVQLGLRYNF